MHAKGGHVSLLLLKLFAVSLLWADAPGGASGGKTTAQSNPMLIAPFDDGVFNLPSMKVPKDEVNADGRYGAQEADRNTEQVKQWKSDCSSAQGQSPQAYRECFARKESESINERNSAAKRVEDRQRDPSEQNVGERMDSKYRTKSLKEKQEVDED